MSTYIIGDVQGCFAELQALLNIINFDSRYDRLGFVGDLINRGPDSLNTLRFIKSLNDPIVVLGNHDIHLLALGSDAVTFTGEHSLNAILTAPDKDSLLSWLRQQPFLHYDTEQEFVLVHAGLPPIWSVKQALDYATEVQLQLQSPHYVSFLKLIYGNQPDQWSDTLQGPERWRYIVNALTRLRLCDAEGRLNLYHKTRYNIDRKWQPWFNWYRQPQTIYFGHWAALEGYCTVNCCRALDTGCVWGGGLTAFRLEDQRRFYMPAMARYIEKVD